MTSLEIVRFCAEEVERQGRGPIQVGDMYAAWVYAATAEWSADPLMVIRQCGKLVEPTKNDGDWRSCFVRVGPRACPPPQGVPALMGRWAELMTERSPAEAYYEFQLIHPFRDGNGRVGKVIYSWLMGEMERPTLPPNFFGCANP